MSDNFYIFENGKKRKAIAKELEQFEKDKEAQRLLEAEQTAKAEAKASAMAKLTALGLNEEEIKALIS